MTEIEELEVKEMVAKAALGTVEELRYFIVFPGAIVINDYFIHWWPASIALGVFAYLYLPYWHARAYEAASDAVERATGTGKYFVPRSD